jgi:hypothetical protein
MKRIIADAELRKKLMYFTTPIEFCDETGQVIARLTPSTPWNDPDNWTNWKEVTPDASDEELQRRFNSDAPSYSTQELIDQIKRVKGE